MAEQIKKLTEDGVEVAVVIGGGNFWRGRTSETIDRTKADQIGMMATVMNCIYMSEICRHVGFFAGGTGHPYFSTDTATALRAIEIEADVILAAKSIDGVYDSDPAVNPEAKKYDTMAMADIVDKKLGVVDLAAAVLCMENKMPMCVFGLNEENSIVNAVSGSCTGTIITV